MTLVEIVWNSAPQNWMLRTGQAVLLAVMALSFRQRTDNLIG